MLRILTLCASAMVAIVLLTSDASACHRRRARCCDTASVGGGIGYSAGYVEGAGAGAGYVEGVGSGPAGYDPRYGPGVGTNPGGIGGPRSGLGVRPGPGLGGAGPRR